MAKIRHYDGDGIRVAYDAHRCLHAEECVHGLPVVFDPKRRPWIDVTAARAQELADVVRRCPTGALRYDRLDGGAAEALPPANRISVSRDGPLYAVAEMKLLDAERRPFASEIRAALCRCGASRNKPFCDGRHVDAGFADEGHLGVATLKTPSGEVAPGLEIRLRRDGPLVLDGRFTVVGSDGTTVEASAAALCRCGASKNKPYCDGTHREIGFRAEDPTAGEGTPPGP
jgi:CDGSH-type Zn-finger protein/uncharacterized Fe-S cluster protein YjdI